MPSEPRGPRLWLRPERRKSDGSIAKSVWIILDGKRQVSAGCGPGEREEAEKRLAAYIAEKYMPVRKERDISEIPVADVINIYMTDVIPRQSNPKKASDRCVRLLEYFRIMMLGEVTGATCRAYAAWRQGKGPNVKGGRRGTGGGARRDLQDLAAAIGHHSKEGLHRGVVRVALPPKGEARQRWLLRGEFAKLLWACWRTREIQEGKPTGKRPLRHLCRFLLLALHTGSRPGTVLLAAWKRAPGVSWVDTRNGVFHRHTQGAAPTTKRQPTVRLTDRILAHLRRWECLDERSNTPRPFVVMFDGEPVASVKTALARAAAVAGIEPVTAYALRHTCASWLVEQGVATRKIADFLGTSEAMIERHYGHLAPDYQDEAAQVMGSLGGRTKPLTPRVFGRTIGRKD